MNIKSILNDEQSHIRKVYKRIIFLALIVHTLYAVLFWAFNIHTLTFYHIFSSIFYFFMLYCVNLGKYRIAVTAVHIEVCVFVIVNTILCGWNAGFALYLIAIATLVYFCPFDHTYIPYLFSLAELFVFFLLKFILVPDIPISNTIPSTQLNFLYFLNAIAAFTIIIYAALISNVSAATTKRVLLKDNENLKDMAGHDQLTTLLNRHSLLEKVEAVNLQAQQTVLIMADIDDFKAINDHYGHPCGDYILQTIALLIKMHLPQNTDICRWGGEEFIILTYQQEEANTLAQMEDLCHIINEYHFIYNYHTMQISMTFGVAYSHEENDFNKLVEIADKRLYVGKHTGKNKVIDHN